MASPTNRKPRLPVVLERRLLLERLEDRLAPGSLLSFDGDTGYVSDASQTSVLPESGSTFDWDAYYMAYMSNPEAFNYTYTDPYAGDAWTGSYSYTDSSYGYTSTGTSESELVTYYAGYQNDVGSWSDYSSTDYTSYDTTDYYNYYTTDYYTYDSWDSYYSPVYDSSSSYSSETDSSSWYTGNVGSYGYSEAGYYSPSYYGSDYYTSDYNYYSSSPESYTSTDSGTDFAYYYYPDTSYAYDPYTPPVTDPGSDGSSTPGTENGSDNNAATGSLSVRLSLPRMSQSSTPTVFVHADLYAPGASGFGSFDIDVDLNQDGQFQDNELSLTSALSSASVMSFTLPSLEDGFYTIRARVHSGSVGGEGTSIIQIAKDSSDRPLTFEVNAGQTAEQVDFMSRGLDYTVWLTGEGTYWTGNTAYGRSTFSMQLQGANTDAAVVGENALTSVSNYFIGDDPSKYLTNIANYGAVRYQNVYEGIDLVYSGVEGQLRHDYVVAAGADYSQISFSFGQHAWTMLQANGEIILNNLQTQGVAFLSAPKFFQIDDNGERVEISGQFVQKGWELYGFQVTGAYDPTRELLIDPTLAYSTFAGGSLDENATQTVDQFGAPGPDNREDILTTPGDIAVDGAGNAYIVGSTVSADFPVSGGPGINTSTPQNRDGFVFKLDATGTTRLYASYFGGDWHDDAFGIAVNASNEAFVVGRTSDDGVGAGTFSTGGVTNLVRPGQPGNSNHAFLVKFNNAGTLAWGSFLAGSGGNGDHRSGAYDVALDAAGDVYVVGNTGGGQGGPAQTGLTPAGTAGDSLYTTTGAFQVRADVGGGMGSPTMTHGFLMKLTNANLVGGTATSAVSYSTYVTDPTNTGGFTDPRTYLRSVVVDSTNQAIVGGFSNMSQFGGAGVTYTIEGATGGGGGFTYDMVLAKINATGTARTWATYIGGNGDDRINALAVAADNSIYIGGESSSGGGGAINTTPTAFRQNRPSNSPTLNDNETYRSGWVGHISSAGAFLAGTYLGATGNVRDRVNAIQVDSQGRVYVGGVTEGPDFPRLDPLQAAFASPDSNAGGANTASSDGFVTVLDPNLSAVLFSTHFGGRADDGVTGLAIDGNDDIFITGFTNSRSGAGPTGDFPILNAFQVQTAGGRDGFVAKIINDIVGTTPGGGGPITPAPDAFEANQTSDAASNLGTLSGTTDINDLTITPDEDALPDYDWFRFTAGASGTLRVTSRVTLGGNQDVSLWRLNGNTLDMLDENQTTGVNTRAVSATVSAGETILVQVKGHNSSLGVMDNSIYNLTIAFT